MSQNLLDQLKSWYANYVKSGSHYSFLTWLQVQRTGTTYFNPVVQGSSGLEIDELLFKHSLGQV